MLDLTLEGDNNSIHRPYWPSDLGVEEPWKSLLPHFIWLGVLMRSHTSVDAPFESYARGFQPPKDTEGLD